MNLNWGTFAGAIGFLFSKLPIQGRKERWKNELDKLDQEKARLTAPGTHCTPAISARIIMVDTRIAELNTLLKNSATD
jgi:hypothetical protein